MMIKSILAILKQITPSTIILSTLLASSAEISIAQNTLSRDVTFAGSGQLKTPSRIHGLQTDDKLVTILLEGDKMHLYRYTKNGQPDPLFGTNGSITYSFPNANILGIENMSYPIFQNDNKILIAGTVFYNYGPNYFGTEIFGKVMCLWRFNSNGELDLSFNGKGYYVWRPGSADSSGGPYSSANLVALQSDGKIVVAGNGYCLVYYPGPGTQYSGDDLTVWRFLPNGTLDVSFNNKGFRSFDYYGSHQSPTAPYSSESIHTLNVKPNDDIVVGIHYKLTNFDNTYWGYHLFAANGSSSRYFNGGTLGGDGFDGIKEVLVLSDNKVLLAKSHYFNTAAMSEIQRIGLSDQRDTTFPNIDNNWLNPSAPSYYHTYYLSDMSFQNDKILIAGKWNEVPETNKYITISRLNANGTLDHTFNNGNFIFSEEYNRRDALAVDKVFSLSDGSILVSGTLNNQPIVRKYGYSPTTNISNPEHFTGINIYPNPTRKTITIQNNGDYKVNKYSLRNSVGQQVLSGQVSEKMTLVDIEQLSSGIYMLHTEGNGNQTFKVIKQ